MKNLLLSCAAILFCCFNFVNAQGCQECAETGGFYCGNDTANWTEYSPNGCVPSYYINDGYADCLDGGDEVVGAEYIKKTGGKVKIVKLKEGYSTTNLIAKLKE